MKTEKVKEKTSSVRRMVKSADKIEKLYYKTSSESMCALFKEGGKTSL